MAIIQNDPPAQRLVKARAEEAFDGKATSGIKEGFRLMRHDRQQLCSVYWGSSNRPQHKYELAISPKRSLGEMSPDKVAKWIEAEIERRNSRGARHKGSDSWPTIGFRSESEYFDFLEEIARLRINGQTEPFNTVAIDATVPPDSQETSPDRKLARFRLWLSSQDRSTVEFRRKAQRIGQALLRRALLSHWSGLCALTKLEVPKLLRASHIKPWRAATDEERLDIQNALLLAPSVDAAFDAGYISFADDGQLMVSPELSDQELSRLALRREMALSQPPSARQRRYLEWHRLNVFRAGNENRVA